MFCSACTRTNVLRSHGSGEVLSSTYMSGTQKICRHPPPWYCSSTFWLIFFLGDAASSLTQNRRNDNIHMFLMYPFLYAVGGGGGYSYIGVALIFVCIKVSFLLLGALLLVQSSPRVSGLIKNITAHLPPLRVFVCCVYTTTWPLHAGYYAGYLSSAFMIGRFAGSYLWGRIADRYGRLPVMYLGLVSTGLLLIAFGLSTSYFWAVWIR